jgi:DNA-binding NarL/FixJ family response regulator
MNQHARLPDLLEEVANAVGVEAALKLAAARGGTKVYIPSKVTDSHWLSLLLGQGPAQALCSAITSDQSGLHFEIPMGPSRDQVSRWRLLHELIDKGLPTMEIARACGVHMRTVKRHRNNRSGHKSVMAQLAQLSLFD